MHNAEVIVARSTLLASCSRLFQEVGPWSLPAAPAPPRSQRQDSLSSSSSSEHYVGEADLTIPQADAEVFISITAGLFRVIKNLEESERRGAPPPVIVGLCETTPPWGWLEYYAEVENMVNGLVWKWDEIGPTAIRNSAKLTGMHQEEAIRKVLHVVRSNNLRQLNERHFDWENRRYPVLASARASPQSADIPLTVPRPSLQLEDARGVSGVIHQSRTPRLCTYEEMELAYYDNEEALATKRRELARRSTLAPILPLGYMKEALEKRLATGLTEPVEPIPDGLLAMLAPEPQEGCTFTEWLHEIRGRETPVPGRTDCRISQPTGNPGGMSSPNLNKPLPPTPSASMDAIPEEEAGFAIPPKANPTWSLAQQIHEFQDSSTSFNLFGGSPRTGGDH
ncbi:hypothetical protein M407DRAFT_17428 [Tulasnella calospora MUT 4182]|uniref:Uncharacterized protein n=1 Tax=Tulasnella calospora MUT 4182 TaxID=1051891 RepID=A0A0C3MJH5_9AGAM|nr:hypothetical protein M407DRAFT_17428 [Tulasnella calospora MUT 4182]